jgi:hypothetical protein
VTTTDPALAALLARLRPQAAEAPALPPLREDPNFLRAALVKQAYVDAVASANADPALTDVFRAAAIVKAWTACVDELGQLRAELDARRNARMEWIGRGGGLPLGPGIPADTTPADAAVLRAAFNSAYERARNSNEDERRRQLADAERFDDDAVRRAVLTACLDDSQWHTVNRWADAHNPAAGALIVEFKQLAELVTGYTGNVDAKFEQIQFAAPPRPDEVATLPRLVDAHNANTQRHNGTVSVRNGQASAQGVLDLAQLLA